jgi:hypothetical protein
MTVKTGSAWAGTFVTLDATGALATPSSGPAGVLYVDGTANAATVTITGSNPYKWAVTLPSLTAGQRVDMYITATIATIATAGIVASEQADTSLLSDGVAVASIAADAIDADALKADAITKIQTGLALEATLTAIKGAGWTDETLKAIYSSVADALSNAENTWTDLTDGGRLDLLIDSIITHLTDIKGAGWTNETLAAIKAAIDAIDVSALATTTHLQEVEDKVDGIKVKTDNLPADPADDSDIDAQLAAVKTVVDAIKTETDGHPTAAEVWSYGTRTLTNSTIGAVTPAEGDTLEVTKDATIIINFTGLGDISAYDDDTTDEEDKVWFTAKENLDDPDSSAVIQIHTLYPAGTTPPDTLDYINGAAATATEGTFQFTDLVAGNATLTLAAAAAADLPVYAVSPLYWDIKILDYSAGTVSVLASGEMYIYGTPTKSIA